jgi:hypothetical protein
MNAFILIYVSTVFSGTLSNCNMKTLSRALRTAVRFMYDRGKENSISSFVKKLLSLPFDKFLVKRRLLMLFKIVRFHHTPAYLKLLLDRGTSLQSSLVLGVTSALFECPSMNGTN